MSSKNFQDFLSKLDFVHAELRDLDLESTHPAYQRISRNALAALEIRSRAEVKRMIEELVEMEGL